MTGNDAVRVRVWVPDVWDVVRFPADLDQPLRAVKEMALRHAIGTQVAADQYEVKYRGALVDENRTPRDLRMPDGAPLIVLAARRRPVR